MKKSPIALDGPARDRAEESGRLRGLAAAHSAAGMHDKAAELHMKRGQMHEEAEDFAGAARAYKDACDCYGKMAKGG